ncbi:transport system membrane protein [Caballeronia catudaia]|uniref:Transport system membrane protein n=1 Tax=Caballeronia catudaia TaxID=1777136 RepID=A0A158BTL7_9BURK|nr:transport system membrane protein [Caballeronia catudaia]
MIGIESAGRGVLPAGVPWICVAVGLLLFRATVLHCRRAPNPAIDFSLLSIPTFHAATVAGSLLRAGAGALPFSPARVFRRPRRNAPSARKNMPACETKHRI